MCSTYSMNKIIDYSKDMISYLCFKAINNKL